MLTHGQTPSLFDPGPDKDVKSTEMKTEEPLQAAMPW